jgi:serine/threonine-protein kinase
MLEGRVLAGRYALERLIGEGGMGAVFSATQLAVQRRVAVKIMLPVVADDAAAVERFQREATLVARITRRGVPQIIDFDRDPVAGPFVVMELLSGESLADRLKRRERIHPRDASSIAASMLETLEAVHAKGIVHRDLKPANVFLAREGPGEPSVKLLDFGVARVSAPHGDMTVQGAVLGTPRFMAPEQAGGERTVDARADLYSVGAVLYACLSGTPPYAGITGEEVLAAVRAGPPASLYGGPDGVAPALVAVVDRAMARAPDARFQTAAEMRAALAVAMAELPEAPPPSAAPESLTVDSAPATMQEGAPFTQPRTPVTPAVERRSRRAPLLLVAGAAVVVAAAVAVVRLAPRGKVTPAPPALAPAAPSPGGDPPAALRDELERARSAWRSGDADRARPMLEALVSEVEHSGARAPSPAARVAAEAILMLGDLDEKAVVAPTPAGEPKAFEDLGPETLRAAREATTRAQIRYGESGQWGAPDMVVCCEVRAGRVAEKMEAFARAAEARELAAMRSPSVEALYPGGAAQLRLGWSVTISSYRAGAVQWYGAAIATARYVDGALVDPGDGTDCRTAALARRDALAAAGDGGP